MSHGSNAANAIVQELVTGDVPSRPRRGERSISAPGSGLRARAPQG
jgi:hypothetical protein